MCYYNLKAYGSAVESWEKLVGTFPLSSKAAEAGFRTGDTYFKATEFEKARSIFRWVVENHPENEYARTSQQTIAQSYYNQQNYDEAIREFQKFLDLFPTSPEAAAARKGMEMCYYQKGLASTEDMQRFVEKFPASEYAAEGQYQIANKVYDDKNYSQALTEYLKVVVNFPSSSYAADALLLAAECAVNLPDWLKATELYHRYLSYFPQGKQRDGVYFNLGTAYYNQKDYGSAMQSFKAVIDSFPESQYLTSAQHNLDICKKLLGEPGVATESTATADSVQADSLRK
jgi:TolA-binding protein